MIEVFSPKRFATLAPKLGLRPGFAVGLCEEKPYGANEGEYWDLTRKRDVDDLTKMVDYEKELVPGLAKQKYTAGEYGHVIPFTDEAFNQQMNERYPWLAD